MQLNHSIHTRPRALVVDDSATLQRQIGLILESLGIEIEFSDRGDEAIYQALSKPYNVIFLDVMLPVIDGYEVCKRVKRDPIAKQVPVIMLTSKGSTFDKVRGIMAGTNAYLTKPVATATVLASLEKHAPGVRAAGEHWLQISKYSSNPLRAK